MEVEYVYQRDPHGYGGRHLARIQANRDIGDPYNTGGRVFVHVEVKAGTVCIEVSGKEIANLGTPEVYRYWTRPIVLIQTGDSIKTADQIKDFIAALELAGRYAENPDLLIQHWREHGSREESETNVYEERLRNQPA